MNGFNKFIAFLKGHVGECTAINLNIRFNCKFMYTGLQVPHEIFS